eukprot:scaffold99582_cov72-Phaeocystis_antarctica.AAC.4
MDAMSQNADIPARRRRGIDLGYRAVPARAGPVRVRAWSIRRFSRCELPENDARAPQHPTRNPFTVPLPPGPGPGLRARRATPPTRMPRDPCQAPRYTLRLGYWEALYWEVQPSPNKSHHHPYTRRGRCRCRCCSPPPSAESSSL